MSDKQNKKDQQIPLWARTGHAKPTSRREFLASGIIPFSAYMMAPSWLSMLLPTEALAQTAGCPVPEAKFLPFITINCSGGAGLASNFIPHTAGGQLLTSYDKIGLGAGATLPIAREFGNVPFAGGAAGQEISRVLRGMRTAGGAALAKTSFVGMPIRVQDDTANNKLALDGMLQKAGLQGGVFPILGTRSTLSGISQQPAVYTPSAPLFVNTTASLANALNYAQIVQANLNATQRLNLAKLVQGLSGEQNRKIASDTAGTEVKKLLDCAGVKNVDNLTLANSGTGGFALPANIATIWGVNANTAATAQANIFGSIVYNVLSGNAGSATLEIGGCDYHDNSRTTGDNKDLEIGTLIGRVLASAEAMSSSPNFKGVFIYVVTDGAVSSAVSAAPTSPWASDRGESSCAYMLCYKPGGRPVTEGVGGYPAWQVNSFTNGQIVDQSATSVVGGDVEKAASAVVANWLSASGQLSLVSQATNNKLSTAEIDKVLRFKG
jgi:hypothetical protein